jgi:chromosome partitioning protein
MQIIAIANQKGGQAKTTTAVNLAAGLAALEYYRKPAQPARVLFVTLDPQADGVAIVAHEMISEAEPEAVGAAPRPAPSGKTMANLMIDDDPPPAVTLIRQARIPSIIPGPNLDYIPVDPAGMNNAMNTIVNVDAREYRLREALEPLERMYKYVVVDTPTTLNLLALTALTAADYFIVPMVPAGSNLRFFKDLEATVRRVNKRLNPNLRMLGILPSKAVLNRAEVINVLEEISGRYKDLMFEPICERADVQSAFSAGMDIFSYRPPRALSSGFISSNPAAQEFGRFVKEVSKRLGNG